MLFCKKITSTQPTMVHGATLNHSMSCVSTR